VIGLGFMAMAARLISAPPGADVGPKRQADDEPGRSGGGTWDGLLGCSILDVAAWRPSVASGRPYHLARFATLTAEGTHAEVR
jgi:hypothetical protein